MDRAQANSIKAAIIVVKAARKPGAGETSLEINQKSLGEARGQLKEMTALEFVETMIEIRRGVGGFPQIFL